MGNERRRHPRIPAELPFRFVSEEGRPEPFELVDLSESGARIRCARQLVTMTRMMVGMVLPGRYLGREDDVRLETPGVVVWSHDVGEGQFDTGVFFPDLVEDHREILRSFVQASA
jgi:hypothetical protein